MRYLLAAFVALALLAGTAEAKPTQPPASVIVRCLADYYPDYQAGHLTAAGFAYKMYWCTGWWMR